MNSMSQLSIEDYIQKVALLEKRVGVGVSYGMMAPFPLLTEDIIDIQTAAKKIAEFIGLRGFTFIVATAEQKEKIGGHIELKSGETEVFVEISDDILKFPQAVLATLAHEITHKYLHFNGIRLGTGPVHEYENEVLTDIATVFLGLGKLMLNGCECQNIGQEQVPRGTRTVTETLKSGYLSRSQLAFVFRLVCAMRRIPPTEFEQGLSTEATQALRECDRQYGYYFDARFTRPEVQREIDERMQSAVQEVQSILSAIDKDLLYLKGACVNVVEDFLGKTHQRLKGILLETKKSATVDEYDPCLQFLDAIKLDQATAKLFSEVNNYVSEAKRYQTATTSLANSVHIIGRPFPKPNPDMFATVTCWNDGTRLKLPQDKPHLIATCPRCQYQFVADTSLPAFKESHRPSVDNVSREESRKKPKVRNGSFWKWFSRLLAGRK